MVEIREAATPADLHAVRQLFLEYRETPGVAECVASFDQEVAGLPGRYSRPDGCLLLARIGHAAVGCAAYRKIGDGICEMKRLFVRPQARGTGAGRALAVRLIAEATSAGYQAMRLDTLPSMTSAIALYASLGFRPIPRYYDAAPPVALFYERNLA